jgi:aryl-alcohol dehydrogenase-like predicted oxidoreductase
MGILTGKFSIDSSFKDDDVRKHAEWFPGFKEGKLNPEWLGALESVREVLTSKGRTLTQGALAWLWGRSRKTIPIPGFKTVEQVEENCKAMEYGPLSTEQMTEVDEILGR